MLLFSTNNILMTDIDRVLDDKFISKERFAEGVEQIVKTKQMNYIDAIVEYCTENNIEFESVSKLISKPLKEKLRFDAMELNYLKQTSKPQLPI